MNIQEVCRVVCILASIGVIGILLLTLTDIIEYIKSYLDKKLDIKNKEISYTYFLNKEDSDYNLDLYLKSLFDEYLIVNGIAADTYIKEDLKNKIIKDIHENAINYMSYNLQNYLLMVYNNNGLSKTLYNRIVIMVCTYVAEHNDRSN